MYLIQQLQLLPEFALPLAADMKGGFAAVAKNTYEQIYNRFKDD